MKRLEGRTAVVTGGASGIGFALAKALREHGCSVVLCDLDEERLAQAAQALECLPPGQAYAGVAPARVLTRRLDVRDGAAWDEFSRELCTSEAAVHILANVAGVVVAGAVAETSRDDAEWIIDVNFLGMVHGCRALLPILLRQDEAHVINVSSMMGAAVGVPKQALYGASKAAVRVFSESLWAEHAWGPVGVTVVLPGVVRTPIIQRARFTRPAERDFVLARVKDRGASPDGLARIMVGAIRRRRRRVVYGWDAWGLVIASRLLPRLLATAIAAAIRRLSPDGPSAQE